MRMKPRTGTARAATAGMDVLDNAAISGDGAAVTEKVWPEQQKFVHSEAEAQSDKMQRAQECPKSIDIPPAAAALKATAPETGNLLHAERIAPVVMLGKEVNESVDQSQGDPPKPELGDEEIARGIISARSTLPQSELQDSDSDSDSDFENIDAIAKILRTCFKDFDILPSCSMDSNHESSEA